MRTPLLLFLLAVVVRLVVAIGFPDPAYSDAAYYVDAAQRLAGGHGFTVDFLWIFPEVGGRIPANPDLPIPMFAHWMPLASFAMLPFLLVLGPTPIAAALPSVLVGAAAAPLAWAIARDARLRREVAVGAGILAAVPAGLLAYVVQPENFAIYGTLAALAFYLTARGLKGRPWSFVLAGAVAGLATLSRYEGLMILGSMGLLFLVNRWRARKRPDAFRVPLAAALGAVALFALLVAPWYVRQLATFGVFSPSTATGKVFLLRDFSEWNSITTPATLDHLLGMGWGPLLATRVSGFVNAVLIFTVFIAAILLAPFLVIGAWTQRREPQFWMWFSYGAALLAFCTILVPVHVVVGQFIHAAVALAPHAYVLALQGAVVAAGWLATRLPQVRRELLVRSSVGALVAFGVLMAVWSTVSIHDQWSQAAQHERTVARGLDAVGATTDDRVMASDMASLRYWTGRGGVVLVNDPVETTREVADAYDVRWLVLDGVPVVPLAADVLADKRPSWVGPPAFEQDDVTIYPVCTDGADPRCTPG